MATKLKNSEMFAILEEIIEASGKGKNISTQTVYLIRDFTRIVRDFGDFKLIEHKADDEDTEFIYVFKWKDSHYKLDGNITSYDGPDWNSSNMSEVKPKEVISYVYE